MRALAWSHLVAWALPLIAPPIVELAAGKIEGCVQFFVQEALRGGIPQSASFTSFAAVYGAVSEDESSGLVPPQSMGHPFGEGTGNSSAESNGQVH